MRAFRLACAACGATYPGAPDRYVCDCGENLEVRLDLSGLSRDVLAPRGGGLLDLAPVLPLADASASLPPLPVGPTPLVAAPEVAKALGLAALSFKDDSRLPSASFKDRASAVAIARAREIGADAIVCASTGNAASATACLAAAAKIPAVIFVPRSAPKGKVAQLVTFGARLYLVDGTYDDAYDLSLAYSERFGGFNRNTGHNPYTREGKKTVAYEILRDLDWEVPDAVVVPAGDGNILTGTWKGFREARDAGLVPSAPRMIAAQAEGSAAIARAFAAARKTGRIEVRPVEAKTIADSISVDRPRDGALAVRALLDSGGEPALVADEAILAAQRDLARATGIFAEPAAAAAFAGLWAARKAGTIRPGERVVVLVTGNGLKDVDAILRGLDDPPAPVVPPGEAGLRAIEEMG